MSLLIWIVIIGIGAVTSVYTFRTCVWKEGIEFEHVLLFTAGFLFYWILPIVVGRLRLFRDQPDMSVWYQIFDGVSDSKTLIYLVICITAYLSFALGNVASRKWFSNVTSVKPKKFPGIELMNIYGVAAIFLLVSAQTIRAEFFNGYYNIIQVEDLYIRSEFAASSVFSVSLWFVYTSLRHQTIRPSDAHVSMFLNRFLVLVAVAGILSISMGQRYLVLSTVLMVAVYVSVYIRKWHIRTIIVFCTLIATISVAVLLLRGAGTGDRKEIIFNFFQEPLNTSFSLNYFLHEYPFGIFRWPVPLLSDYIYLVPRAVLPTKDSMRISPSDLGFDILNPVGGLNSFFSCMVNFGAVGTFCFMFCFSGFLGWLKAKKSHVATRVMYAMTSGWLIVFFRNPFEVTLVKEIFQLSIIVPMVVLGTIYFVSQPLVRNRALPGRAVP